MRRPKLNVEWFVGTLLILGAFTLYVVTGSHYASSGGAVQAATRHCSLNPFLSLNQRLWEFVSSLPATLPLGTLEARLGIFSALCSAAALALFWLTQRDIPFRQVDLEKQPKAAGAVARVLSAGIGTALLAVLMPFWTVSNRPHVLSFNALLFMATAYLVVRFCRTNRAGYLYGAAFLAGVTGVEYAGIVIAFPVLLFAVLLALANNQGAATARQSLIAVGCFVGGTVTLPLFAFQLLQQPEAGYQGLESMRMVVGLMGREHLMLIRHSVPKSGWILVGLTSVLPWMVLIPPAVLGDHRAIRVRPATVLLHGILVLVALGLAWNLTFAPWELPGVRGALVLPSIFIGSWVGYLVAHWYLVIGRILARRDSQTSLRVSRGILVAFSCFVILVAGIRNLDRVDAGRESYISEFAARVVDDLADGEWLFGHGPFLNYVWLAADEAGKNIQTVDVSAFQNQPYLRYLATISEDSQEAYALEIGATAFLRARLQREENLNRTAVIHFADMLNSAGFDPIPEGMFYRPAVNAEDTANPAAVLTEARRQWDATTDLVGASPSESNWTHFFRTILSKHANNTGVYLQDLDDHVGAMEAYEQARRFKSINISALLNLYGTAKHLGSVQTAAYEEELNDLLADGGAGLTPWALATQDGYVRSPHMFREMGLSWAMSGSRKRAVEALERAEALGGGGAGLRNVLAGLYMLEEDWENSAQQFEKVLENRPKHVGALIGMSRLSVMKGDYEAAQQYLDMAEQAGASFARIGQELAILRLAEGQGEQAAEILERLVQSDPDQPLPIMTLAMIYYQQREFEEAKAILEHQTLRSAQNPTVLRGIGLLWASLGDRDRARAEISKALKVNALDRASLEVLLKMQLDDGELDEAVRNARTVLNMDLDNSLANYVMGLSNHVQGNQTVAEQCYRNSLRRERRVEALNNLAVILIDQDELAEASELATEATDIQPGYAAAWDTLGYSLLKLDRFLEARQALEKALALEPNKTAASLNLLDVAIQEDDQEGAAALVQSLETRELTDRQADRFEALRAQIKRSADPPG